MATYFSAGATYVNSATQYGLRPRDQRLNIETASQPEMTYQCVAITPTHATFKRLNPRGSGATYNAGILRGETIRCRVMQDLGGYFVMPMGRSRGRIILRP